MTFKRVNHGHVQVKKPVTWIRSSLITHSIGGGRRKLIGITSRLIKENKFLKKELLKTEENSKLSASSLMDNILFLQEKLGGMEEKNEEGQNEVERLNCTNAALYGQLEGLIEKLPQLSKENKHLREMNAIKDLILQCLRHDSKIHLQGIIGFSEILLEKDLTADEKEQVTQGLKESVNSLLAVLNSLGEWSRTVQDGKEMEKAAIGLKNCVSHAFLVCKQQAEKKGVILRADSVPVEFQVLSDKEALEMILRNIVSNAIKFSKEGGTVEVLAFKNNGNIEISVKDNGVGMSSGQITSALASKGGSTQGTNGEMGSGLGIPMILYVLKILGSKPLRIESPPGKGTTISFTLPAAT